MTRGRPRSEETADLPPGMTVRRRSSGDYFYLVRPNPNGRGRLETPLGAELSRALLEYKALTGWKPPARRSVARRPWLALDLFRACRANAKRRGIGFELTEEDVRRLLEESKGRCTLTGIQFDLTKQEGARARHWMPSIDREDCAIGYTPSNVRLVASAVNIALSDFGEEVLVQIARALLRKRRSRL